MLKCNYDVPVAPALSHVMIVGKFGNTEIPLDSGGSGGSGIVFKELTNVNLCSLRISAAAEKISNDLLKDTFGFTLPDIGFQSTGNNLSVSWIAQNEYLLKSPRNEENGEIIEKFKQNLTDTVAALDKSHSFCLLEISGNNVMDLLEKSITLDLRDSTFPIGASTSTIMTHNKVVLQRLDVDQYHLYLPRTHAFGIWNWLVSAAEEFGYEVID